MDCYVGKAGLSQFPTPVAAKIKELAKPFPGSTHARFKKFRVEDKPLGTKVYHAEGHEYFYYWPSEKRPGKYEYRTVEMAAEHNIGAAGLSHKIGAEIAPPAGAYVIEYYLFYNKWYCHVTRIYDPAKVLN